MCRTVSSPRGGAVERSNGEIMVLSLGETGAGEC